MQTVEDFHPMCYVSPKFHILDPDLAFLSWDSALHSHPACLVGIISFVTSLVLLVCSAFISAAEFAFFSLSPKDVSALETSQKKSAERVLRLLKKPEEIRITALIVDTFLNVMVIVSLLIFSNTILSGSEHATFAFILQIIVIAIILLFFGEILPQVIASKRARSTAMRMSVTLLTLRKLTAPLVRLLSKSSYAWKALVVAQMQSANNGGSESSHTLDLSPDTPEEDKEMIEDVIKFGNIEVVDIMRSRIDMVDISTKANYSELLDIVVKSGYSRIPVYGENRDNIQGLIYSKDLFLHMDKKEDFEWQSLMRPAYFVPEGKKIDDLLREFQANKVLFAIVVDEYGGTSGLVTMEDILEEIVGDINDEYDEDEHLYTKIDDNTYIFEGKTLLNDFYKITDIDERTFAEIDEEVESLAGMILEIKGEMPERKEKIVYGAYEFEILGVDERRIKKIKISRVNG